jgi:chromosome segregation ATPase
MLLPSPRTTLSTTKAGRDKNTPDSNSHSNDDDQALAALQQVASKVALLTTQLSATERELKRAKFDWMREKAELIQKVSLLTKLLNAQNEKGAVVFREEEEASVVKEEQEELTSTTSSSISDADAAAAAEEQVLMLERELKVFEEHEEDMRYEQERLEREVGLLQDQMIQLQNIYRTGQRKSEELQHQLDKMENAWELERIQVDQERIELQRNLEDQARIIEDLQSQVSSTNGVVAKLGNKNGQANEQVNGQKQHY